MIPILKAVADHRPEGYLAVMPSSPRAPWRLAVPFAISPDGRRRIMDAMVLPWFERRFEFTLPIEAFPVVVERLRGTPARIEEKLEGIGTDELTRRDGDAWSVQEHVGHLLDLDDLHTARLDDFLSGAGRLRPADLQNRRTHEARHNEKRLEDLLAGFRRERGRFVERLDAWAPEQLGLTSVHPRLQQPMRVIDMALFVADHDDHHLARMTELLLRSRPRAQRL